MHGLYKCVLTFCAVFVGLILAVMGLLGIGRRHLPVCGHGAGRRAGARVHPSESRRS